MVKNIDYKSFQKFMLVKFMDFKGFLDLAREELK